MKIVVLAAGRGSRMQNNLIHKGLLPYKGKALISHLIDDNPGAEITIAVYHLADQLKTYINAAHPNAKVQYVNVGGLDNPNSGPGFSLLLALENVRDECMVVTCDTYFKLPKMVRFDRNWLGVGKVNDSEAISYCNLHVDSQNEVVGVFDKVLSRTANCAWTGLMYIKDWVEVTRNLSHQIVNNREIQCSHGWAGLQWFAVEHEWVDLGTKHRYEEALHKEGFDYSKPDEQTYVLENTVIKFFGDVKRANQRKTRQLIDLKECTPPIIGAPNYHPGNFLVYEKAAGKSFYECGTLELFSHLLEWLAGVVWNPVPTPADYLTQTKEFYKNKTRDRVMRFLASNPGTDFETVNGVKISTDWLHILDEIDWDDFVSDTRVVSFHGDLNFDNIIVDESKFTLIDWRDSFGALERGGDLYYEYAKLLSGITFDFDLIKKNTLQINENHGHATISFARRTINDEYEKILLDHARHKGLNVNKISLLRWMLIAGMSGVHKMPYAAALYFYSLSEVIKHLSNTTG